MQEHGYQIINIFAHEQVSVFDRVILHTQLLKVKQGKAAAFRILHGIELGMLNDRAVQTRC